MKALYLCYLTVCLSFVVQAAPLQRGGVDGGGGKGVVCRNSKRHIVSAETLDLFEAKNVYNLQLTKHNGSVESIVTTIKSKLAGTMIQADFHLLPLFDRVTRIMKFVPATAVIVPVDDAAEVVLPKNCRLEQLANYIDDDTLIVSQEIWNALSATDKAALIAHEAVYRLERTYGAKDSRRARKVVAHAFSDFEFEPVLSGVPEGSQICTSRSGGKTTHIFNYYPSPNSLHTVLQFTWFEGQPVYSKKTATLPLALPWLKNIPVYCGDKEYCNFAGSDTSSNFESTDFITIGRRLEINDRSTRQSMYLMTSRPFINGLDCYPSHQKKSFEVYLPTSTLVIIPSATSSCLSVRQAEETATPPTIDITAAHVRIPNITIRRNRPDTQIRISNITAHVTINGANYESVYTGAMLTALNRSWWQKNNTRIAPGMTEFSMDCPMHLGSFTVAPSVDTQGLITVTGVETDIYTHQESFFQTSTPFQITPTP